MVTLDTVRRLAKGLKLAEGTSYGTPGWRGGGKLVARSLDDPDTLVVKCDADERAALMDEDPETFFLTDHYVNYPWVIVRLSRLTEPRLKTLLATALTVERPPRQKRAAPARKKPAAPARRKPAGPAREKPARRPS